MNSNLVSNTLWILRLSLKHAPIISLARLVGFITNYINSLARAFVVGVVIDQLIEYVNGAHDSNLIFNALLIFGLYYLLTGLGGVAGNFGNNLINFRIGYQVSHTLLYEKLNRLGSAALEEPEVQNKVTRYRENNYTFNELARYLFTLIGVGITLLVAVVPLFTHLPVVTILLVVVSIPAFIVNKSIINQLWKLDKDTTVLNRRGSNIVSFLSHPASLKEIKLLSAYDYLKQYFEKYITEYEGRKLKIYTKWSFSDAISILLTGSVILFGIYSLIQLATDGIISIGQIAFYISALMSVGSSIDNFSANFASYTGASQRVSEMRELLDWPEPDNTHKIVIAQLTNPPHIKIENASFKYPNAEKFVIKDLSLEIKPGEKIAIVGENGAGKTTLVKLLSNIYPVTSGEITVDGQNLNSIDADSWFKNLGVLYQDYNSYGDLSAFENIALGKIDKEVDYDEITEAAKKADAYDFIMEYKDNFSQILSERYEGGTRPSTGQWQKIAIARFFYRNAPILILDEPTASIDAVSEANIFDRIYKFIENKTVIIVSHRFATVRNADRIIVFDHGQIVEQGSHEELLKLNGKYAHAFNLQAKGYS